VHEPEGRQQGCRLVLQHPWPAPLPPAKDTVTPDTIFLTSLIILILILVVVIIIIFIPIFILTFILIFLAITIAARCCCCCCMPPCLRA
jgi:hypothetical protein